MKSSKRTLQIALASVVAAGFAAGSLQAADKRGDREKCAGIVKAGKNDCGTSYSSCAGTSKVDGDKEAWVYLPKGLCERIAGGMVTNSPHAMPGGKKG